MSSNETRNEQFVSLFVRNQWALFSYIFSLLPSWADAEDMFQQTSMILWRKFEQFDQKDPQSNFVHWACQIARFEVLNYMKKNRRDRHVFSDTLFEMLAEEGMSETARLENERRALAGCLDQLQTGHRRLIQQCYAGKDSVTQVAQWMGCTPNSLYKRLHRIRIALLRCIEQTLAAGGKL
ncbi:MAG: sigma-70 family RNA polymerase sigma factor [Pirellulales bacterium]|nr:sigma-70 family RNA polymerase sigma factor [Pirellulales bacterium]